MKSSNLLSPVFSSLTTRTGLAVLLAAVSMALSACGQKGPLYMPKPPERPVHTAPADGANAADKAGTAASPATTPAK